MPSRYLNRCWLLSLICHEELLWNFKENTKKYFKKTTLEKVLWKMEATPFVQGSMLLTYWGGMTHICISKLTIIASDNGLSPGRRQAIIWTNAGILSIRPLGTNFIEILIKIYILLLKKIHLKMSSENWWLFCLSHNVLRIWLHHPYHGLWHTGKWLRFL